MATHNLCWLIVLVFTFTTVNSNTIFNITYPTDEWWSNTIIYQVYPRSFKDSNNDGIGDLNGITEKLDHFVDIGVETLWIGPIFKSPMDDMGYDVEDYYMIDPIFGTMEDFKKLIYEMNKRNLKMITDLVPNHSSYKSEWFQKSIKREGKYTDYYVWKDAKNQKDVLNNPSITPIAPNNWLSVFGGSAWKWHSERKQFYLHQFSEKQPDFNLWNPDIKKEILDILEYWLDNGISGFRFDAINYLFEDKEFKDEPFIPGIVTSTNHADMNHPYTRDQPEDIEIVYEWREFMDNYKKKKNSTFTRLISIECYTPLSLLTQYYGNDSILGSQVPFYFGFLLYNKNNMVDDIENIINLWLSQIPKNMVPNWVIENHDNPRIATGFGPQMVQLFTALKLMLPGVDVTFYGSEIGMENVYVRPDQVQDSNNAGGARSTEPRDYERSPMQWDDTTNAGFTKANKPWLPVNPNYYKLNVEAQKKIPTSNYNFYKKMVQLRNTDTLKYGDLHTYNVSNTLYILKRSLPDHESYVAVMNVGSETETLCLSNVINNLKEKLYVYIQSENSIYIQGNNVSTHFSPESQLQLRPQSVIVFTDKATKEEHSQASGSSSKKTVLYYSSC